MMMQILFRDIKKQGLCHDIIILLIFFIPLLFAASCYTPGAVLKNTNVASIYNPGSSPLHPKYKIFHKNDTLSYLYVNIDPNEFLFNRANKKNIYQAKLKLKVNVYDSYNSTNLIDTVSVIVVMPQGFRRQKLITFQTLKLEQGRNYVLVVYLQDLIRETMKKDIIEVNKTDAFHAQNILFVKKSSKKAIFEPFLSTKDTICVRANKTDKEQDLTIERYDKRFRMPPPPFVDIKTDSLFLHPDSTWKIHPDELCSNVFNKKGVYLVKLTDSIDSGRSLSVFYDEFPELTRPTEMIEPLQYLCTRDEFLKLNQYENPKLAVDEFWLKTTSSFDHARELIRIYYNRVKYANIYFTNHSEGWRTDRGMIYVIFGPPLSILKDQNKEVWVYRDNKTYKTIQFTFNKIPNKFSDDYFSLQRSINFKPAWYNAVNTWREGNIYYSAE